MKELEARALVYRPPSEVFGTLADVPGYARYSPYLRSVSTHGDGGSGTEYSLRFGWRGVGYTIRVRVTEIVRPLRIRFTIPEDRRAHGEWIVERAPGRLSADPRASLVRFVVRYDPDTDVTGKADLPPLVSLDRVVELVVPLLEREAERVVERAVEDLEGSRRDVSLDVRIRPNARSASG